MTLLTYNSKYVVQSATAVPTSSSTFANDTQATQTFNLTATKTVLIIYTANSNHLSTNGVGGIKNAINIDGTDFSQMNDSGNAANYARRNSCIWVGSLAAGDHTINGRLASAVNAQTTTVDNRTLLIYVFNGDEFWYVDNSTTAQTCTSATYIDDSVATTTVSPSGACTALVLYAITNLKGSTERYTGKKICINIAGEDKSCEASKSSYSVTTSPDSVATVYAQDLTTGSTAIKGRLSTNTGTQTVTVNRHVLGILLFDTSVILDLISSVTSVNTTFTTLTNDTGVWDSVLGQSSLTRTRDAATELLIIGQANKKTGTTGPVYGLCYGLNIDNTDVALSRSSPTNSTDAESSLVAYATLVATGEHVINGRFATNYTGAAYVDTRILIALWFTPIPPTANFTGTPLLGANPLTVQFTNTSVPNNSIIVNSGLEAGLPPNLKVDNNTSATQVTTYAHTGTYSMRMIANVTTDTWMAILPHLLASTTYYFELWYYSPVAVHVTGFGFTEYGGSWRDVYVNSGFDLTANTWTKKSGVFTTPSDWENGCTSTLILLRAVSSGGVYDTTKPLYIDDIVVYPVAWSWDFGDTGTSTSLNPSHEYSTRGVYTVSLTAYADGVPNTKTETSYLQVYDSLAAASSKSGGGSQSASIIEFEKIASSISGGGSFTSALSTNADLSGFLKYVDYTFTSAGVQTNAQIPIIIYRTTGTNSGNTVYLGTDINSDFSDIRFTSADGNDTNYKYFIESLNSNGTYAYVWVQVPSIPSSGSVVVRLQYKNSSAVSASDSTTWDYFTDFAIESPVWNRHGIVELPPTGYNVEVEATHLYEGTPQILTSYTNVFKQWARVFADSGASGLRYSESVDGINWTAYGSLVLTESNSANALWCPFVLRVDSNTLGCYVHNGWSNIDYYTSPDGITWTRIKTNTLVASGSSWENTALGNICVWKEGTNDWRTIYEGQSSAYTWALGYATSTDGQTWTKSNSNPVISVTGGSCGGPSVHKVGSTYYMWYHFATSGTLPTDMVRAHSTNLTSWTLDGPTFYRKTDYEGFGDSGGQVADPDLLEVNGITYMWYDAVVNQTEQQCMALATYNGTIAQLVATSEDKKTLNHSDWTDVNAYCVWSQNQDGTMGLRSTSANTAQTKSNYTGENPCQCRIRSIFRGRAASSGTIIGMRNYTTTDWAEIMYWADASNSAIRNSNAGTGTSVTSNADASWDVYSINILASGIQYTKNGTAMTGSPINTNIPTGIMPVTIETANGISYGIDVAWLCRGKPLLISPGSFGAFYDYITIVNIASSKSGSGSQSSSIIEFEKIASSFSGGGSETSNLIKYNFIVSVVTGGGLLTAQITEFKLIISFISGSGSQISDPATFEQLNSIIAATGALTANMNVISGTVDLSSSLSGDGTLTANIIEYNSITSSVSGGGSESSPIIIFTYLPIMSSISGGSSLIANLIEFAQLLSSTVASASETANILEYELISSTVTGVGTETANLTEFINLLSSVSGSGSQTANLIEFINLLSSVLGAGSQAADVATDEDVLLTYNTKYVVPSATAVPTSSSTFANDTQATKTFSLTATKTVLIIYTANSTYGSTNNVAGIKNAINIDGADVSQMNDSGYAANHALRNSCIWVGQLTAGSHTINGRLASVTNGQTTTVNNRTLLIYVFNGNEFIYVDDTTSQTCTSTTYIDDSVATATFTPSGSCVALVLYALTNVSGSTERYTGKKICIKIAGTDKTASEASKSSYDTTTSPDSVATVYAQSLSAVETTIKGRWSNNVGTQTTTASRHVLAILLLDPVVHFDSNDLDSSVTSVNSSATAFGNDSYISVSQTLAAASELLVIAQASKQQGTTSSQYGLGYGLNIDNTVDVISRSSPAYTSDAESSMVAYAATLASGSHTINGRFASNYANAAYVDTRILVALWFPATTALALSSAITGTGAETASMIEFGLITASESGAGSQTAMLSINKSITSSISAGASQSANIAEFINLLSSVFGSGSQSANLTEFIKLLSSVLGAGSQTVNLIEFINLLSSVFGEGGQTANIAEFINLLSSVLGSGSQTANIAELKRISSSLSGSGSQSSSDSLNKIVISSISGDGSETANIKEFENINSSLSGGGSLIVTGFLNKMISSLRSGDGSQSASIIKFERIVSSLSGVGAQNADPKEYAFINTVISGGGSSISNITGFINLLSSVFGEGGQTANLSIYENLLNATSAVFGAGDSTSSITELNYIYSHIEGNGALTSNTTLLEYIASSVSSSGSVEAGISLNRLISSIVTGGGNSTADSIILEMLNSNIAGIGYSPANQVTTIYLSGNVSGGGSQIALLSYRGRDLKYPLTYTVYQKTRTATIYQKIRTVTIYQKSRTATFV